MAYMLTVDPSPDFGTGLVQRIHGLGAYMVTPDPSPDYGTALVQRIHGLGDGCGCGEGCGCSGGCGLGLFSGGMDLNTWGMLEWGIVGLVGLGAISAFNTGRRGVSTVRKGIRRRKATKTRKRELQAELKGL